MKFKNIFLLLSLTCFISCSDKTEELSEESMGFNYFPIETGKFKTYRSDSIIYSGGGTRIDTFTSYTDERIGGYTIDLEGNKVYIVERYFKRNIQDNWSRVNSWTVYFSQNRIIRTEENLKFIKLVFPTVKGKSWNGNIFLDDDIRIEAGGEFLQMYRNWNYRIENLGANVVLNNLNFDDCLIVRQVDVNTVIDRRRVYETYARGVGLVSKEMIILDGDGSGINLPWEQRAKKGFIHQLTLIDYN
jgi:hypothetical protein